MLKRLGARLRRPTADPVRLRRAAFWLAVGVAVYFVVTSAVFEPETPSPAMALALLLLTPVAVRWKRMRYVVLGVAAGALAFITPDAIFLWPAVSALVFISVVDDPGPVPWVGWFCGIAGSVASLLAYSYASSPAPFLATFVGGTLALLLRTVARSDELAKETRRLRGRAAWLEQRTSLARELHDVVGHHVTAMVVQAEAGQMGDPQAALRTIGDLGRTALRELDALVAHLRDPDATLSVSAPPRLLDIDELLAEPLRQQGVEVSVRLEPEPGLDEAGVLTVYRIAQEALTNVARHAGARHAWVELARVGDRVRLRVSDDGVGPERTDDRGSGLLGIEERVSARRGTWDLSERPGGGTMLDVNLPVAS